MRCGMREVREEEGNHEGTKDTKMACRFAPHASRAVSG
jgi:hypothetical protein